MSVLPPFLRPHQDGVLIDVVVQPRAARARVGPPHGDRLKVAVTAPPVDGAANRAVIELIAQVLSCPRSRVELFSGASGRRKTVLVRHIDPGAALPLLLPLLLGGEGG